jgi:hypothetical protein
MLVEEYIQIAKEAFPYLFDEYGFKLVYSYQGEGRDLGRYAFGIESAIYRMRILFSRQQGAGMIYFGQLTAPFANEYSYLWIVNDGNLLMYLNRQRVDWSELDPYTDEDHIRPGFQLISRLFKPHCPGVLEMFSSEEAIATWKPQYEQYIDKAYRENPRYHHK